MTQHQLTVRRELRHSFYGNKVIDWNAENAYPCVDGCQEPHRHSGSTVLLFADCTCGWSSFVGNHIYENHVQMEARMRFLQHQIDQIDAAMKEAEK